MNPTQLDPGPSSTAAAPLAGPDAKPTNVRYFVLAFLAALSMITYLDRACFGSAAGEIQKVFGMSSDAEMAWAYFAFVFAYAVFEIPSGWLGDVFGPQVTLVRIVIGWSIFTALTGMVGWDIGPIHLGFGALLFIRFMFGVGEAGAYPNITRALHNWFPITARGAAQGTIWMSGRMMGGLTPMIWAFFVGKDYLNLEWRQAFFIFGGLGIAWCLVCAFWFRNTPEEMPGCNEAEQKLINEDRDDTGHAHSNVPWLDLLTSTNLWALCFMYFCMSFGWYFNLTYLPKFMEKYHDIPSSDPAGALYKGLPLILGAFACILGGWLTDVYVAKTGDRIGARRNFGIGGMLLAGICYAICPFMPQHNALPFALAISFAAFFNDMTMGAAWATCQDIGRRHAAIVAGAMNMIGNLGGAVVALVTGWILKYHLTDVAQQFDLTNKEVLKDPNVQAAINAAELPGYNINFYLFAGAYFIAALLWLRINAGEPVVQEEYEKNPSDFLKH